MSDTFGDKDPDDAVDEEADAVTEAEVVEEDADEDGE